MDASLIFNVPDSSTATKVRCLQAISQMGAPLRSDSGHFITGVVSSGQNNIEVRVTWLEDSTGTQVTVNAAHEDISEEELQNVTQRFRREYLGRTTVKQASKPVFTMGSFLVVASCLAALAFFIFALLKHKN